MVQVTVRYHDQIYALWRDSGPPQVRLEPGKAAEGWAELLTKAGIDKDTFRSCVDHQNVVRGLDNRLHEVCLQHRSELSFRGVHSEGRPDRNRPIAIRDHGCLEVADLEAIEAIAVLGFRAGLTGVLRLGRGGGEQRPCRCSNSQPGAGKKYTATGQDRRGLQYDWIAHFPIPHYFALPAGGAWIEAPGSLTNAPLVSPDGTSAGSKVRAPSARAKDFVSWRPYLRDMEGKGAAYRSISMRMECWVDLIPLAT